MMQKLKMKNQSLLQLLLLGIAASLFAACGGQTDQTPDSADAQSNPPAESGLFLQDTPGPAQPIAEVVQSAQAGDSVTVSGQIGGTTEPFGEGYALFMLADESLVFCNEMSDEDHCPTPWDACCEDPDKLRNSRAMIQIIDDAGEVRTQSLKNQAGLRELEPIVLSGTVIRSHADGGLVINARKLYRGEPTQP